MAGGVGRKRTANRLGRHLFIVGVLTLVGAALGSLGEARADVFPLDAIGKLIVDDDRLCTAFVVRSIERHSTGSPGRVTVVHENWLATAGHCLGQTLIYQQGNTRHQVTRIIGYSAGDVRGHDVMVAAFFTNLPVPTLAPAFGEYPQVGDPLLLIGYGRKALMMRVGPLVGYDDRGHMEIVGYASPGNSGGPVLVPGTRRVVGIGIETTVNKPEGAALYYCAIAPCAVKPPYVAAHIDRLLGVASFR